MTYHRADIGRPADYRVSVRVRNNRLLRAIEATGAESVAAWCRDAKLPQTQVNALITMRTAARLQSGEWSACALAVANALRQLPEDLFSEQQQHAPLAVRQVDREVDAADLAGLLSAPPTPECLLLTGEANSVVDAMLAALPPRERTVIEARLGLDGDNDEKRLDEVGALIGVSRERVRQIEMKALRRMRQWCDHRKFDGRAALQQLARSRDA